MGADVLTGGSGDDTIEGGAGNDFITSGTGDNAIFGGEGSDRLSESADVDFTLTDTTLTGIGSSTHDSIEQVSLTGGEATTVSMPRPSQLAPCPSTD